MQEKIKKHSTLIILSLRKNFHHLKANQFGSFEKKKTANLQINTSKMYQSNNIQLGKWQHLGIVVGVCGAAIDWAKAGWAKAALV